jgi:hypothetical protein
MKKTFFLLILFVSVVLLGNDVLAQAGSATKPPDPEATCKAHQKTAILAYCDTLVAFQKSVTDGTTKTVADARPFLNKLDLTKPNAAFNFITVAANQYLLTGVLNLAQSKVTANTAMADAGQARIDQQFSAPTTATGTTSLVSKPGSADLLSLALDAGVLTRSVNGTTTTLSTNADQVFRLITGNDPDCTVTCKSLGGFENRVLNPLNVSATLDVSQTGTQAVPTTGQASGTTPTPVSSATIPSGAGKLTGIVAKYRLLNQFDPRTDAFKDHWKTAVTNEARASTATTLGNRTVDVLNILQDNATPLDDATKQKMLADAQSDPTGEKLIQDFSSYFDQASLKVMQDPTLKDKVGLVMQSRALYRQAWLDALAEAAGTLLTFEYDYNRPVNQPFTHDFKLVYSYDFKAMGMVTFNGAYSIYDGAIPAGAKYGRTHYGQISAQYDRTVSGQNKNLQTQISLAGYWQYQPEASILNIPAGTVAPGTNIPLPNGTQEFVGTAGSLWVTQAKFTIRGAGGINVPIGVSWSNKTDLLQGSKVGAQVGISYNFSSLAGLFTGLSQ